MGFLKRFLLSEEKGEAYSQLSFPWGEEEEKGQPEEAPKDAIFGQYLFAPDRSNEGIPPEKDTKEEDRFRKALSKHFEEIEQSRLTAIAPEVLDVLAKHQYEPLLDPGKQRVFRVITLSRETLISLVEKSGEEVLFDEVGVCKTIGTLRPQNVGKLVQSWSTDVFESSNLSTLVATHLNPRTGAVMFVAYPHGGANKFFGKPGRLAGIIAPEYSDEYETISFGPVEYVGFSYMISSEPDDTRTLFEFQELADRALEIR